MLVFSGDGEFCTRCFLDQSHPVSCKHIKVRTQFNIPHERYYKAMIYNQNQ